MSRAGYESYKEFTAGQGEAGPAESINQASVLLTLISLQIPLLTTIEMTTVHCEMLLTLQLSHLTHNCPLKPKFPNSCQ